MDNPAYVDKLAWIHIVDGEILCTISKNKDTYFLPGGKREPGETDQQALIREIKEELTVDLLPDTLRPVGIFEAQAYGKPAGVPVRMSCYTADYKGMITPASEIAEIAWFTYEDKEKASLVAQEIFDWLYERGMIAG